MLVLVLSVSISIVSARRGFVIDIIGHVCIGKNSTDSIRISAGLNVSDSININMSSSMSSSASTSIICIASITFSGRFTL